MAIRSPIVVVLGHVDHGKTTLLDKIRGTTIAAREPGAITQHVGASFIPTEVIKERCEKLLKKYKFELRIPGLLFIDTPGHEAFTNLRKRGGNAADLAVLVIDVMQGIQPQTEEAIKILKNYKTPFVVAANKIDLINGWQANEGSSYVETIKKQRDFVIEQLERNLYDIVGQLSKFGYDSDIFTNVKDITKQVLVIPVSAKTCEGFPELLMFLAGLSQKFMEKELEIDEKKPAVGTVLEVKEVSGLGITIDVIIFDGVIRTGDQIALAGFDGPFTTKVRALLKPAPLEEIRDPRKKFKPVDSVYAAAGVKIAAPNLEKTIPGSPLLVTGESPEKALAYIRSEIESIKIEKEELGVIIKTDALGSLEAIVNLFTKLNIPVRKADVGAISRKDISEAESVRKNNRYLGVIFAFNVPLAREILEEANKRGVPIFESNIIYMLEENYKDWRENEEKLEEEEKLEKYIYPAKIKILSGTIFRVSNPAIVGVEVLAGIIKAKYPLMRPDGKIVGRILSIQDKNKTINKAEKGMQVAISIDEATVGRQIEEDMILFTAVPKEQIYALMDSFGDKELLREIKKIKELGG